MNLRDALTQQAPSLALQRAAADEIARIDADLQSARRDVYAALDLVSRIRFALGDNSRRMQDELIEHCRALAAGANNEGVDR